MSDLDKLQKEVIDFRDRRDWKQFHNPKDLAISLLLEAAELLEHFQWKNADETARHLKDKHDEVSGELMDVLYWIFLIAHDLDIDIKEAFNRKMAENTKKYPVKKAKGSHSKYTEL